MLIQLNIEVKIANKTSKSVIYYSDSGMTDPPTA